MDKVICHICGEELEEWDYVGYWLGGTGNVLRPVCKDKSNCTKKLNELLKRETINV